MWAWCDDDQEPASGSAAPEHQVRALSLATPGVEGRAEQDILDLLRSDLVACDVGNTARVPQHTINPHSNDRTPAWYATRAAFSDKHFVVTGWSLIRVVCWE
jgi:hypothetical protein